MDVVLLGVCGEVERGVVAKTTDELDERTIISKDQRRVWRARTRMLKEANERENVLLTSTMSRGAARKSPGTRESSSLTDKGTTIEATSLTPNFAR